MDPLTTTEKVESMLLKPLLVGGMAYLGTKILFPDIMTADTFFAEQTSFPLLIAGASAAAVFVVEPIIHWAIPDDSSWYPYKRLLEPAVQAATVVAGTCLLNADFISAWPQFMLLSASSYAIGDYAFKTIMPML